MSTPNPQTRLREQLARLRGMVLALDASIALAEQGHHGAFGRADAQALSQLALEIGCTMAVADALAAERRGR